MIRFSAAFLLTLPVAAAFSAAPALAQYNLPPPGAYEERLPPVMGEYDDDDSPFSPPGTPRASQRRLPTSRVFPYPDDDAPLPPPTALFGAPEPRPAPCYRPQPDAQQPPQH